MFYRERIRWGLALTALMFAAFTIASIARREDFATIASSGIAAAVLGGIWYFLGWLQYRS
jgi:hypothetical protein